MRIKFICCDVFARLAYAAAAVSPHIVDLELLPMLAHTEPAVLRAQLQTRINAVDISKYDRIALGYGLCGNATMGLTAPLPMVMPRTHDCCAVFLGSRARFAQVFGQNLSMRWCTCGYYERCHRYGLKEDYETYRTNPEYVRLLNEYGEDNAEYVWQTMHPSIETKEAAYIRIDGHEFGDTEAAFAADVAADGKGLRTEPGDAGWFNRLVSGPQDDADFLLLSPGQRVAALYDMERVIEAR